MAARQGRGQAGDGRELHPSSLAHGPIAPKELLESPIRRARGCILPVALFAGGPARYDLPATARTTIRKAFEARLSAKIRRVYELRPDLQTAYPLAYLPSGRARFFRWLIAEGREQNDLSDASIWWFLIECDEDPARELIRTYKISPSWQRFFPDALTPVGWDRFAGWLKCRHCIDASGVDYHSIPVSGLWKSSVWRMDVGESGNGIFLTRLKPSRHPKPAGVDPRT